jgi:hypothetical protein
MPRLRCSAVCRVDLPAPKAPTTRIRGRSNLRTPTLPRGEELLFSLAIRWRTSHIKDIVMHAHEESEEGVGNADHAPGTHVFVVAQVHACVIHEGQTPTHCSDCPRDAARRPPVTLRCERQVGRPSRYTPKYKQLVFTNLILFFVDRPLIFIFMTYFLGFKIPGCGLWGRGTRTGSFSTSASFCVLTHVSVLSLPFSLSGSSLRLLPSTAL